MSSGLAGWGLGTSSPHYLYSNPCKSISLQYRTQLAARLMAKFNDPGNYNKYKAADRIFYEYSVRAPRLGGNRIVDSYLPLLYDNFVVLGINIPWEKRLFHNFYREILTSINREVAKYPTNRGGTSISAEHRYFLKDLAKFLIYPVKKKS